ncbi:hypothetical protein [Phyllobacterium sp. YR531]|nr:hypothetical protein [Phyllobacterium sp. YR531]EJN05951.1 hypothetical protein PMI41_00543 [Phyllobacterium sp. YR531]
MSALDRGVEPFQSDKMLSPRLDARLEDVGSDRVGTRDERRTRTFHTQR